MIQLFVHTMTPGDFLGICLVIMGLICVALTYGAAHASKKSGHYVSGMPVLGAILILIGGLLSAHKILALLCLTDPGPWGFVYAMIREHKYNKRIYDYLNKNGLGTDRQYLHDKRVTADLDGDILEFSYVINSPYILNRMRIMFAIILDGNGDRFILLDRREKGLDKIPFNEDRIRIDDPDPKGRVRSLTIEVRDADIDNKMTVQ